MRLRDYLSGRGESQLDFAARASVPQSAVSRLCNGGGVRFPTAAKIIRATRESPAPDGGTVTWEDLIPEEPSGGSSVLEPAAEGAA